MYQQFTSQQEAVAQLVLLISRGGLETSTVQRRKALKHGLDEYSVEYSEVEREDSMARHSKFIVQAVGGKCKAAVLIKALRMSEDSPTHLVIVELGKTQAYFDENEVLTRPKNERQWAYDVSQGNIYTELDELVVEAVEKMCVAYRKRASLELPELDLFF